MTRHSRFSCFNGSFFQKMEEPLGRIKPSSEWVESPCNTVPQGTWYLEPNHPKPQKSFRKNVQLIIIGSNFGNKKTTSRVYKAIPLHMGGGEYPTNSRQDEIATSKAFAVRCAVAPLNLFLRARDPRGGCENFQGPISCDLIWWICWDVGIMMKVWRSHGKTSSSCSLNPGRRAGFWVRRLTMQGNALKL